MVIEIGARKIDGLSLDTPLEEMDDANAFLLHTIQGSNINIAYTFLENGYYLI